MTLPRITPLAAACLLAACGGPRARTATPADVEATAMKPIDASLGPEAACEQWARLLIEEPGAVPLAPETEVTFHGRLTNESRTPVPDSIRASASRFELEFDIDIARKAGDGVRCGGMFVARTPTGMEEAAEESPFEMWLSGRDVDARDLADGQWQAAYFMDVDLVPLDEGLAAGRAFIALQFESYRSGQFASRYGVWLDDAELEEDVNGDGKTEQVVLASEHEELTSPLTEEYLRQYWGDGYEDMGGGPEEGAMLEETIDAQALVIHDEEMRFLVWETYDHDYSDNLDYFEPPPRGFYELLDLGIGRTVFAWIEPNESMDPACVADGEEDSASIEIFDLPTYKLLEGEHWSEIFAWTPPFKDGQPCGSYPWEVTIEPVRPAEGPWEVHVAYEWEDDEVPDKVEVWRYDGKRYVFDSLKIVE